MPKIHNYIETYKSKLQEKYGDEVILKEDTFINSSTKCIFIDKIFGEWCARPSDVLDRTSYHPIRKKLKMSKDFTKPLGKVQKMLFEALGDTVTIDKSTYVNLQTKCTFIDKDYGEWQAIPRNVIHQQQRHPKRSSLSASETWLEKYGVPHASQNKAVHEKIITGLKTTYLIPHWKTDVMLKCQCSYEKNVVLWLNIHKIEYEWQPQKFTTPLLTKLGYNRKYTPDLYLTDKDLWVEIKGYFTKELSRLKWEWFHKEYPNSELWDRTKLKGMGIKIK